MAQMPSGATSGPVRRRRTMRAAPWAIGGVVVLLATAAWFAVRPDADAAPDDATSPSASRAPSAAPSPTGPTGPTPAAYSLTTLTRPDIDEVLPSALPPSTTDTLDDLPGSVAVPRSPRIPAWAAPDVTQAPVLALESEYYDADARWLALEREPGWVRVLVPYGRGALPSDDPERVNGVSAWVRADDVDLEPERRSVVVDLSDRTVTINRADGTSDQVPAAVGAAETPTPQGLTQVFTVTEAVNTGLSVFLSMQSETLDGFYGTDYAATAFHVGEGQGQAASNGCLRLTPADFEPLTTLSPGVPILITP